jgi:hypothetical protein
MKAVVDGLTTTVEGMDLEAEVFAEGLSMADVSSCNTVVYRISLVSESNNIGFF